MCLSRVLQNTLLYIVSLEAVEYDDDDDDDSFLQVGQRGHREKEVICVTSPKL